MGQSKSGRARVRWAASSGAHYEYQRFETDSVDWLLLEVPKLELGNQGPNERCGSVGA